MKLKIIAIFCIWLIISSSLSVNVFSEEDDSNIFKGLFSSDQDTGESIIINVDKIEPFAGVPTSVIENQNAPVYVFLKGSTLGSLVSKDGSKSAPLYGIPKIKSVDIQPTGVSRSYVGPIQYVRPVKNQYVSQDGLIDMGFLIVMLKRISQEGKVPDKIDLTFDADIRFDLESGFGNFGEEDLVLKEAVNEENWKKDLSFSQGRNSFWGKEGYARASKIDPESVSLNFYNSKLQSVSSTSLRKTEISQPILLRSGFKIYDRFRVRLNDIKSPQDKAVFLINKNGEAPNQRYLAVGSRLYPGSNWKVVEIRQPIPLLGKNGDDTDGKKASVAQVLIKNEQGEVKVLQVIKYLGEKIEIKKSDGSEDKSKSEDIEKILVGDQISRGASVAIKLMTDLGLTDFQAAGIAGNLVAESGVEPARAQNTASGVKSNLVINGRTGYGYAQWTDSIRQRNLASYAKLKGVDWENTPLTDEINYGFLVEEFKIYYSGVLNDLRATKNVNDASDVILQKWEIPKDYDKEYKKNERRNPSRLVLDKLREMKIVADLPNLEKQFKTITSTTGPINCEDKDVLPDDDMVTSLEGYKSFEISELKKKTYCNAINDLKKVIELEQDSENADEAYFYLGKSYDELNDNDNALKSYSSIRSNSIYFDSAQLAISSIESKIELGIETESIYLEDEDVYLTLKNIEKVTKEDLPTAYITFNGITKTYQKDDILMSDAEDEEGIKFNWAISSVNDDNIVLKQVYSDAKKYGTTESLRLNDIRQIITKGKEKGSIQVTRIDTKQEAYVTILPGTGNAISKSQFKVHIPIEKRPFKLTPDEIDNQINQTRNLIKKMDDIIKKMDNVLKVWKGACIFVYGFLTLKNFLQGPVHLAARREAMDGTDGKSGWKMYCTENSGGGVEKKYSNYDECIIENKISINKEIEINEEIIKGRQADLKNEKLFEKYKNPEGKYFVQPETIARQKSIDKEIDALEKANVEIDGKLVKLSETELLKKKIKNLKEEKIRLNQDTQYKIESDKKAEEELKIIKTKNPEISKEDENAIYESYFDKHLESKYSSFKVGTFDEYSVIRSREVKGGKEPVMQYYTFDKNGDEIVVERATKVGYEDHLKKRLNEIPSEYDNKIKEIDDSLNKNKETLEKLQKNENAPQERIKELENDIETNTQQKLSIVKQRDSNEEVKEIQKQINDLGKIESNDYIHSLNGKNVYKTKDGKFITVSNEEYLDRESRIRKDYASRNIEYYENGRPYCVPTGNGNYVKVLEHYGDGSPKTIAEWNVGPDGVICNEDDVLLTSEDVLKLTEKQGKSNELKQFVNRAKTCTSKDQKVTLSGLSGQWICSYSKSLIDKAISKSRCTDVMDIGDCQIMFNVCDPVMCPSSRFNLGGRWELSQRSVVETGLIGSLVLGMPNWFVFGGTNVIPPICATGISASLKSWRSVMQGYQECLQVSKTQDKSVGICDKVRSVFMCEIFWKEGLAILDVNKGLLSLGLEAIYGDSATKGGGEYLTFKDSLDNVGESVSFFTDEYAQTAFAAYKARSTDEVGSDLCKAAIFGKAPGIGEFFEDLTAPESPPQFTAFFDVLPYSSSAGATKGSKSGSLLETVQEQNRYQIYYHIYAGEDQKIDYSVYLKDRTGLLRPSYFTESCTSNFGTRKTIEKGQFVDKSLDCVDRTGYDQICVELNGRESCGFGKVSTSFGLKYLNDLVVKGELSDNINSTEECRPNNPSIRPQYDLGLNLENNYGIINSGLVRVCNPTNPGNSANDPRWEPVGTCTRDPQGNVISQCWLDMKSYDINDVVDRKEITDELTKNGLLKQKSNLISLEESDELFNKLENDFRLIFELTGSDIGLNDKYSKLLKEDKSIKNSLSEIQQIIKYSTPDEEGHKSNYRYLISVSPKVELIGKSRIRIAQVYYSLGRLFTGINEGQKTDSIDLLTGESTSKNNLNVNDIITFTYNGIQHTLKILKIEEDKVTVEINSQPQTGVLNYGKEKKFDIDESVDGEDIIVSITKNKDGSVKVTITGIKKTSEDQNDLCVIEYEEDNMGTKAERANFFYRFNNNKWEMKEEKVGYRNSTSGTSEKPFNSWVEINSEVCNNNAFSDETVDHYNQVYKEICDTFAKENKNYESGLGYLIFMAKEKYKNDYLIVSGEKLKGDLLSFENLKSVCSGKSQIKNLPIEIRIVLHNILGDNFFGDLLDGDYIYSWSGDSWSGGDSSGKEIEKYAKSSGYSDGVEYIKNKVFKNEDYFSKLILSCGDNEKVLATKSNLFSVDINLKIKEEAEKTCGYKSQEVKQKTETISKTTTVKVTQEDKTTKTEISRPDSKVTGKTETKPITETIEISKEVKEFRLQPTEIKKLTNYSSSLKPILEEVKIPEIKFELFGDPLESLKEELILKDIKAIEYDGEEEQIKISQKTINELMQEEIYDKVIIYEPKKETGINKEDITTYLKNNKINLEAKNTIDIDDVLKNIDDYILTIKKVPVKSQQGVYEEKIIISDKDAREILGIELSEIKKEIKTIPKVTITKTELESYLEELENDNVKLKKLTKTKFDINSIKENLDKYVVSLETIAVTNQEGIAELDFDSPISKIIISDKDAREILGIELSEIKKEIKKQLTCIDVQKDNKLKSEGGVFDCNPNNSCRLGSTFNKGQLDCGQGNSCCRVSCESAYSDYECTDTSKFSCEGEKKLGYCSGSSNVVCCKKGSSKNIQGGGSFLIDSDTTLNKADVLLVTTSKLQADQNFKKTLNEWKNELNQEGLITSFLVLDTKNTGNKFSYDPSYVDWSSWNSVKRVIDKITKDLNPKYLIIFGGDKVVPVPYVIEYDSIKKQYNFGDSQDKDLETDEFYAYDLSSLNLKPLSVVAPNEIKFIVARFPSTNNQPYSSSLITKIMQSSINFRKNNKQISSNPLIISDMCGNKEGDPSKDCIMAYSSNEVSKQLYGESCPSNPFDNFISIEDSRKKFNSYLSTPMSRENPNCVWAPPFCSKTPEGKEYCSGNELKNVLTSSTDVLLNAHANPETLRLIAHNPLSSNRILDSSTIKNINLDKNNPLFFIMACRSNSLKPFDASIAGYLLNQGSSSVIGMSTKSHPSYGKEVPIKFYQNLRKGLTFGESLFEAKKEIYKDYSNDGWKIYHAKYYQLFGDPTLKAEKTGNDIFADTNLFTGDVINEFDEGLDMESCEGGSCSLEDDFCILSDNDANFNIEKSYDTYVTKLSSIINERKDNGKNYADNVIEWASLVFDNAYEKSPEYLALISSLIEEESGFKTDSTSGLGENTYQFLFKDVGLDNIFGDLRSITVGCMNLKMCNAEKIALKEKLSLNPNKKNNNVDTTQINKDVYKSLQTKNGCVYYGNLHLLDVIKNHFGTLNVDLNDENVKMIISDYSSGSFNIRNKLIQIKLNKILGENLYLDGDLQSYDKGTCNLKNDVTDTENSFRRFIDKYNLKISDLELKGYLKLEKTKDFENTKIYLELDKIWSNEVKENPELDIILKDSEIKFLSGYNKKFKTYNEYLLSLNGDQASFETESFEDEFDLVDDVSSEDLAYNENDNQLSGALLTSLNIENNVEIAHPKVQIYDSTIKKASRDFDIDENLIKAKIIKESFGDPYLVNPSCGDVGFSQLLPLTAKEQFTRISKLQKSSKYSYINNYDSNLFVKKIYSKSKFNCDKQNAQTLKKLSKQYVENGDLAKLENLDERFSPEKNIYTGSFYLSYLIHRFNSETLGLAAYNRGPKYVLKNCLKNENKCKIDYVKDILAYRDEIESIT